MPWYVLLIIALASILLVVLVLVSVARKAWRLAKHGMATSSRLSPLVSGLSHRADEITSAALRLSSNAEQMNTSIARLQRSLTRLQVISVAISDAVRPYRIVRGWFSGSKEWGDTKL